MIVVATKSTRHPSGGRGELQMSLTEQTLPTGTWNPAPAPPRASFAVKHAGLSTFRGHFTDFTATLEDGVLTGTVKVDSVDVPVDQLKGHLQGPDFFDAERHPEITFTASELVQDG